MYQHLEAYLSPNVLSAICPRETEIKEIAWLHICGKIDDCWSLICKNCDNDAFYIVTICTNYLYAALISILYCFK